MIAYFEFAFCIIVLCTVMYLDTIGDIRLLIRYDMLFIILFLTEI